MRVSLLLMRDLAWMALLLLCIGLTFLTLAVTRNRAEKSARDR